MGINPVNDWWGPGADRSYVRQGGGGPDLGPALRRL